MPTGISQDQVNAAADQLVAAGNKPTVEKVRQVLGTGSPNTITRMLETWREELAQRMAQMISLPDVPGPVGVAFMEVWRLAIEHAKTAANEALIKEQNAIAADRASLNQEAKVWQIAVEAAQRETAEAASKWTHVQTQLMERDALLEQLKIQQADLMQQRDLMQAAVAQYQTDIERLQAERTVALDHVRVAEDRAHRLVDEARLDAKALQARWEREERETSKRIAQLTDQAEQLHKAVHTAEQATAREAGRVLALEATLKQFRGALPLKKTKTAAKKKTKTRAKRSGRAEHA
ncbi:DNA-binding protein [Dyella caseinilytica]|uniref:DNA-binding protein n=1 Tax=Dyella caseinilytica TaxID=1849581 RepID=A0ABX7H2F4_9GAMM|nr:DNA-binding protein [Dyella caseinilytica]QRN55580.1 DNA-binding protein [Dyella caseinilytica]GGA02833.1 hypothetical protein GCM10011408_25390 [Dyella caseinilytica]